MKLTAVKVQVADYRYDFDRQRLELSGIRALSQGVERTYLR